MRPQRIQLRRTKGWRKPDGAIVVARPTKWGNPFPVKGDWTMWTAIALGYHGGPAGRRHVAVMLHRAWLTGTAVPLGPHASSTEGGSIEFTGGAIVSIQDHVRGIAATAAALTGTPPIVPAPPSIDTLRYMLGGHDLACWCKPDQLCHADTLLTLANP